MCDEGAFLLAEYEDLRQEIRLHQATATAILAGEFAILVGGLTIAGGAAAAAAVISILTSVLWVRYMETLESIFRAAYYIAIVLKPRMDAVAKVSTLEWEIFLRRLRKGVR